MGWLVKSVVLRGERLEGRVLKKRKEELFERVWSWIWGWTGTESRDNCVMTFWDGGQSEQKGEFLHFERKAGPRNELIGVFSDR